MAQQDLYRNLLAELSASAAQPITDPGGTRLTLRGAVAAVFDKLRTLYRLTGRPVDPRRPDDLYGHVMSARAENLITQHLLAAVTDHLGLDTEALYRQAREALQ